MKHSTKTVFFSSHSFRLWALLALYLHAVITHSGWLAYKDNKFAPYGRRTPYASPFFAPLGAMLRQLSILVLMAYSVAVCGQPAEREFDGANWECAATFAAVNDRLTLYHEPDMRSETVVIPYGVDWRIPFDRRRTITRVLSFGTLRVKEPDEEMYCPVQPSGSNPETAPGDLLELVWWQGQREGDALVKIDDAECIVSSSNPQLFEIIEVPETQEWLRVLFADGTSPGWLHIDLTQVSVYRCGG